MKATRQRNSMLIMTIFVLILSLFNTGTVFADDGLPPTESVATAEPVTGNVPANQIVIEQPTAEPVTADVLADPIVIEQPIEDPVAGDTSDTTAEPIVIDQPTEIPASEGTSTKIADQTVSEILDQLPEDTHLIVLDEKGALEPLATENAAEIIATSDPMWCPTGQTPGNAGCTSGYSSAALLMIALNGVTGDGTIYFMPTYSTNDLTLDHTNANLLGLGALTIQGGWNGSTGNAFALSGSTTFTGVGLTITNWTSDVTINDVIVDGANGNGITVNTTGNIILDDIQANNNSNFGAFLNNCTNGSNCTGSGDITMTGTNTFNNNGGLFGLYARSNGGITLNNVTASNNDGLGTFLIQPYDSTGAGNITLTGTNTFNNNGGTGLDAESNGNISLNNITANENGQAHMFLADEGAFLMATGDIILTGTNTFNNNQGPGLGAFSDGNIIVNNLTSNENGWSGSIIKSGHGRSIVRRSQQTVVQQDRHVHSSGEPEQLQGLKDRILAWAQLHYTKRRQE